MSSCHFRRLLPGDQTFPLGSLSTNGRVDFPRSIGEAAKSTRVAMSSMVITRWENRIRWKGVNMSRAPMKSSVHMNLPVKRLRTTTVAAANVTIIHTPTLKSDGERSKTVAAKGIVAISVMRRLKTHAFDCNRNRSWSRLATRSKRYANIASRSLNREGAGCFSGLSSRLRTFSIRCLPQSC